MQRTTHRGLYLTGVLAAALLATSACSSSPSASTSGSPSPSNAPSSSAPVTDNAAPLVVGVEGKAVVLNGTTLDTVATFDSEKFIRLNAAGDGQNVLVTTSKGFQVLDARTPKLTDLVFTAPAAGHVVRHAGNTVLYADGSGETTIFPTASLAPAVAKGELPKTEVWKAPEAHHGVSIVLENGNLLTTVGDSESRSGIVVLDKNRKKIAENKKCPGVHGEGAAAKEAVVFGCNDGALLVVGDTIKKFQAPDKYGRMGNAYVSETSQYIVGDYNDNPDAEGVLLHKAVVIDTAAQTYKVIDMPKGAEYSWRDVTRGPDGLAYILATDGAIHVLDPATGKFTGKYPIIAPWQGPAEWQQPHPAIVSDGKTAYVTEPAKESVHHVDLTTGTIIKTAKIAGTPNEIAIALG